VKPIYSLLTVFCLSASPAMAQVSASDSFESGDLSAGQTGELVWESTNRTSLVKRDPQLGDMVIFNGSGAVELLESDKDWRAKDGQVSMRFDFKAGKNAWAEQRFSLQTAQPEIWIRYWLRVPTNFQHVAGNPSNHKLLALWMDDYSSKGAGPSVIWEFWSDGNGGSELAYHYSPGGHRVAGAHKQQKPFISYPADRGRWMQIAMHVKAASSASANDGVIRLYRRWDDEKDFTLLHDDTSADIAAPTSGPFGWKAGYFMGWSNPGYQEPTEWLLDDVALSGSSLLDASVATAQSQSSGTPAYDPTGSCSVSGKKPPRIKQPG
jgi:hypothetical protein